MLLLGSKANPRPGSKNSSDNAHDRNASDLWRWLFGISIFSSFMVCYIRYTQTRKSPCLFPVAIPAGEGGCPPAAGRIASMMIQTATSDFSSIGYRQKSAKLEEHVLPKTSHVLP